MSKFAVFDIDGTLFRSGLYREVVYQLIRQGAIPVTVLKGFAAQEQAWRKRAHGNAFKEFDQAMVESLEEVITNLKIEDYDKAVHKVIEQHKDNVYVYTRDLAKDLKSQGYFMIAISGSQTELVEPFAQYYEFDHWIGQHYERNNGYFTGEAIKTHKDKHLILEGVIEQYKLDLKDSYGIGDSRGDTSLLKMVDNAIAFNPDHQLYEAAIDNNWNIVLERKNVIYELRYDKSKETHLLHEARKH